MVRVLCVGLLVLLATEARAAELLVFDWNKPVTKAEHGFPWDDPPLENGDWTQPVNYAGGTLHYRVEIFSQPVAQDMKLQFCFWQQTPSRENCGPLQAVKGTPGTVATWSCAVGSMWQKDGLPIVWTAPRQRNGVAIKDSGGLPVSDYAGWSWNGHDPDDWYPLSMRFSVVVVEQGKTFSGWSNYVTPPPDAGPPDQAVPSPDQAVPSPDQAVPSPDQAVPLPDQGPPLSDAPAPGDGPAAPDAGAVDAVGRDAGPPVGDLGGTLPDAAGSGKLQGGAGCATGGGGSSDVVLVLLALLVLGGARLGARAAARSR